MVLYTNIALTAATVIDCHKRAMSVPYIDCCGGVYANAFLSPYKSDSFGCSCRNINRGDWDT